MYKKMGRQPMARSQKTRIQKAKAVVQMDSETEERLKYLGELLPADVATTQDQKGFK